MKSKKKYAKRFKNYKIEDLKQGDKVLIKNEKYREMYGLNFMKKEYWEKLMQIKLIL